jgi:superfamily II DNA or RNA helicase
MLQKRLEGTNRKLFYIHGEVEAEVRNEMRSIVENEKDAIILGSIGCMAVGINIRNLHNIVLATPSKSRIQVLQSIGRQLRKSASKLVAKLYDIGDDLSWKSHKNYTLLHYLERLKIYNEEQFEYRTVSITL